jgi:hypothetical protein
VGFEMLLIGAKIEADQQFLIWGFSEIAEALLRDFIERVVVTDLETSERFPYLKQFDIQLEQ